MSSAVIAYSRPTAVTARKKVEVRYPHSKKWGYAYPRLTPLK